MQRPAQTKVVFADLRDTLVTLNGERESPKNVRRAFSRFVELSQKLTSAMRKDYSCLKSEPWKASAFSGWTPVTELFKYLRNEDQHGDQISISMHERRFYPMPTDLPLPIKVQPGQLWMFEGTWNLDDQLLDAPPDGISKPAFAISACAGSFSLISVQTSSRWKITTGQHFDEKSRQGNLRND